MNEQTVQLTPTSTLAGAGFLDDVAFRLVEDATNGCVTDG